jgi:hypothetical protein
MSEPPVSPRWRILLTPRWLSWHLFAVVAVAGMCWLGQWQFERAMAGNTLSWAYTFEWPIFAIFGVVFWVKTIRDELHPAADRQVSKIALPAGVAIADGQAAGHAAAADTAVAQASTETRDVELAEYNAYLAKLSNEVKRHGRWHGLR